ncbi:histidine kinase sensor domain-containing protein, partial [Klebsiella pneumoniae]
GWGLQVERNTYFLEQPDRIALAAYAAEAEQVVASGDAQAVERWRLALEQREHTWVAVLDDYLQSLGTTPLDAEQVSHLTFMRKLSWP